MSQCRYCTATWGEIGLDCADRHGEREIEVARQIAARVHGAEATDEHVGGFMEDAEDICRTVPDEHPIVTRWDPRTMRLTVSGHRWQVADEGGGLLYRGGPKSPTEPEAERP